MDFINEVAVYAQIEYYNEGVMPSLTIAQAILESGWGRSGLATKGKALFGIKATKSWKGSIYVAKTQECYNGTDFVNVNNVAFRAYDSWGDSVTDHTALIANNSRYIKVLKARDYKTACIEVQKAGYATDPNYSEKLIEIIEEHNLNKYDKVPEWIKILNEHTSNHKEWVKWLSSEIKKGGQLLWIPELIVKLKEA